MKKVAMFASVLALGLAQPVMAQDAEPDFTAMANAMADVFKADPLTEEQQARLPQAEMVVQQLFPAGTYRKMMDQMVGPMMDGVMGSLGQLPLADVVRGGGLNDEEVAAIGDTKLGEVAAMFDPAYEERQKIMGQVSIEMVTQLMDRIEPSYRAGLARAYASRFSAAELTELHGFFSTPVGSRYAGESMLIYADPQVMAAMNEMMPAMFEMLPGMMESMNTKTAHLPPTRTLSELSETELGALAKLLGVPADQMKTRAAEQTPVVETIEADAW